MKWDVEVTHRPTGEELTLRVEAPTREDAESRVVAGGLVVVNDSYRAGLGFLKPVRVVAWVWFWLFTAKAALLLLLALAGVTRDEPFLSAGASLLAAAPGWAAVRAVTYALHPGARPGRRRGFEVVPLPPRPAGDRSGSGAGACDTPPGG